MNDQDLQNFSDRAAEVCVTMAARNFAREDLTREWLRTVEGRLAEADRSSLVTGVDLLLTSLLIASLRREAAVLGSARNSLVAALSPEVLLQADEVLARMTKTFEKDRERLAEWARRNT